MENKPRIRLNSRQRDILLYFLETDSYGTLGDLAERLNVSVRTLQRELSELEPVIEQWGLKFDKKAGLGLKLAGDRAIRDEMLSVLEQDSTHKTYTPEERQFMIKQLLLSSKDPVKLYYLSSKLCVTESTISYDLNRIEPWLGKSGIRLVRKPGLGVYIEGNEKQIRAAIADLLYEKVPHDQLLELLHAQASNRTEKLERSIRDRLLHFIEPQWLFKIEQVIQDLERKWGYDMADSAYVGFVVHLALAVQRFKNNEEITIEHDIFEKLKTTSEYALATELAAALSSKLELSIPESEIGYITMHLLGARSKNVFSTEFSHSRINEYVSQMISVMERELKLNLENDLALTDNLVTHLTSAVQRIELGMTIRNPLLEHVKQQYSDIFEATRKASKVLERQIGAPVPDEEIGYLAMHFGTAILRKRETVFERRRVLLVCSSGIGASRLLSAQLEKKLPQLHVVDTISLFQLEEWLRTHSPVDLVISTMSIHQTEASGSVAIAVVNPFLTDDDIAYLENKLNVLPTKGRPYSEEQTDIEEAVEQVEGFGKALASLLNKITVFENVSPSNKQELIQLVLTLVEEHYEVIDAATLRRDLERREELGPVLLEEEKAAMLHCRSEGIGEMCICVLKLNQDVNWTVNGAYVPVRTVLTMMGPVRAPKEYFELISEISVALIDEEFTEVLINGTPAEIQESIRLVLKKGYLKLAGEVLR